MPKKNHLPHLILHVWVDLIILSPSVQIPPQGASLRFSSTHRVAMGTLVTKHSGSVEDWSLPLKPRHKRNGTAGETLPPSGAFAKGTGFQGELKLSDGEDSLN